MPRHIPLVLTLFAIPLFTGCPSSDEEDGGGGLDIALIDGSLPDFGPLDFGPYDIGPWDGGIHPDAEEPDTGCPDDDSDGVCNENDICAAGDDNDDADNDGVPDACDPCPNDNPDDSDSDGVCDSDDICAGGDDNDDADMDTVPDHCDICAGGDDNADADMDLVPDHCDICAGGNDNDDADMDLVPDHCDICAGGDDNVDTDMDTVPDFCDICAGGDDNADADLDTVPDHCDRCPGSDDRNDGDLDGQPDDCDPCPVDNPDDTDGDGICDSDDICAGGDDNLDGDNDGVPNYCDNCPDDHNPLQEDTNGIAAYPIPFVPVTSTTATSTVVALSDDDVGGPYPIGFSFNFFSVAYTDFYIASNGFMTFSNNSSSGCCEGGGIPYVDTPNNLIALGWTDLNPPGGGTISYVTDGVAPNRRLIVDFIDVPWCCGDSIPRLTSQAVLFEGSDHIEVHTSTLTIGHRYTRGTESRTGTIAAYIRDERWADFMLTDDAVGFDTGAAPDGIGDVCANASDVQFAGGSGGSD